MARRVAVAGLCTAMIALSGCGFHMAGSQPLPPALRSVYVQMVSPYDVAEPTLQAELIQRIQRGGGKVVSRAQGASSVLKLFNLKLNREAVAIGPDGRALQYRLITSVSYSLSMDGKRVIAPETQTVSSDYSFSAEQILAKEEEQARLERYIQGELAELILLRIRAELTHQAPAT